MTLGAYPAMGLAQAHEAWRSARADAQAGRDPSTTRKRETSTTDFKSVTEDWLARGQGKNKTQNAVRRLLEKDAMPLWAGRQMSSISRRDILDVIDSVAD